MLALFDHPLEREVNLCEIVRNFSSQFLTTIYKKGLPLVTHKKGGSQKISSRSISTRETTQPVFSKNPLPIKDPSCPKKKHPTYLTQLKSHIYFSATSDLLPHLQYLGQLKVHHSLATLSSPYPHRIDKMITSTRLEAQVVYFDLRRPLGSGFFAENWTYFRIPISIDHLKVAPTLPKNCEEYFDEKQRQLLGYLSGLYGKGGDMEGWYGFNLLFCSVFFFFFFLINNWMLMDFCFSYTGKPFDRRPDRQ